MITIDTYLTSCTKNVDCTKQVTQITWVQWKKWQVNILYVDRKFTHALRACIWQFLHARLQIYQAPGIGLPGYLEDCQWVVVRSLCCLHFS